MTLPSFDQAALVSRGDIGRFSRTELGLRPGRKVERHLMLESPDALQLQTTASLVEFASAL